MGEFRDAVSSWVSFMPTLGNAYFWVVAITSLSAAYHVSNSDSAPAPSPTAGCDKDTLVIRIFTFAGWMITLLISTYLLFNYVKTFLDTAADIESKLNSIETEVYKTSCDELKQATAALKSAKLSNQQCSTQQATRRRDALSTKSERSRPKDGLARLTAGERKWVRSFFILAILFSFVTGIFASLSFYTSLQLRIGCVNGFAQVGPFILVGTLFLLYHVQALVVAGYAY